MRGPQSPDLTNQKPVASPDRFPAGYIWPAFVFSDISPNTKYEGPEINNAVTLGERRTFISYGRNGLKWLL